MNKNTISVFLSLEAQSPHAGLFKPFCAEYSVPGSPAKLLALQCSEAVNDGAYLRVTMWSGPNQDKQLRVRIQNQYVLLISDDPLETKKIGFVQA